MRFVNESKLPCIYIVVGLILDILNQVYFY